MTLASDETRFGSERPLFQRGHSLEAGILSAGLVNAVYLLAWTAIVAAVLITDFEWRTFILLAAAIVSECLSAAHYRGAVTLDGLFAALAVLHLGLGAGVAMVATSALIGDGVLRRRPSGLVLWNLTVLMLMVTAGAFAVGINVGINGPGFTANMVTAAWLVIFTAWLTNRLHTARRVTPFLPGISAIAIISLGLTMHWWGEFLPPETKSLVAVTGDSLRFAGAFMLVDFIASSMRARLKGGSAGMAFWDEHLPLLFFRYNGLIIGGALLAYWASIEGDTVLVLALVGLLLAQAAYLTYEKANRMSEAVIAALGEAIDARDPYTAGHSLRVSDYAERFATFLGWSRGRAERLRKAALMHDIGKIGIPDAVLFKPGKLDRAEFEQMKRHAPVGESIVSRVPGLERIARIAGEDHERWAGGGYPRGIKGDEIMPEARLLAIVDVFDAMTTDRPYRAALTEEAALLHIESVAGDQLDPGMVRRFVEQVRAGRESGVLFCYCATH